MPSWPAIWRHEHFEAEFPCHGPEVERSFRIVVTAVPDGGALITHFDITGEFARVGRWQARTPTAALEPHPQCRVWLISRVGLAGLSG